MSILSKNPILQSYILRRYEQTLGLYYLFNAKNKQTWSCPDYIGNVLIAMDGSLSIATIISILAENNSGLDVKDVEKIFIPVFEFLYKEGFLADDY